MVQFLKQNKILQPVKQKLPEKILQREHRKLMKLKKVFQEQNQKVSFFPTLLRRESTVKLKRFLRRENKEFVLAIDREEIAMRRLPPID